MRLKVWTKALTFGSWFGIGTSLAFGLLCTTVALGDVPMFPGARYWAYYSLRPNFFLGDLNGDGVPDLAVASAHHSHGRVSVLLGLGDGTLAAPLVNDFGYKEPWCVASGDLNGDNIPDLATANRWGGSVSVLLGIGDGTFAGAVHYPVVRHAKKLVIGDVDGDDQLFRTAKLWNDDRCRHQQRAQNKCEHTSNEH